ncbi:MAG: hypothetical protein J3Q66DRAFT_390641 [Benniella sp.]|nr:MAG: hypothetical protein J3Q66DRAFT_390641 [Benniella sp.]
MKRCCFFLFPPAHTRDFHFLSLPTLKDTHTMSRQASSHSRRSSESYDIHCHEDDSLAEGSPPLSKGKRKAELTDHNDGDDEDTVEHRDRPAKRASASAGVSPSTSTSSRHTRTRSSEPVIKKSSEKEPENNHPAWREVQKRITEVHELLTEYLESLRPFSSYSTTYSSSPSTYSTLFYGASPFTTYFSSSTYSRTTTSTSLDGYSSFYFSSYAPKLKTTTTTPSTSFSKSAKPRCSVLVLDEDADVKIDIAETTNKFRFGEDNDSTFGRVKTETAERPIKAHRSTKMKKEPSTLRKDPLISMTDEPQDSSNMKEGVSSVKKKKVEGVRAVIEAMKKLQETDQKERTAIIEKDFENVGQIVNAVGGLRLDCEDNDEEATTLTSERDMESMRHILKAVDKLRLGSENEDANDMGPTVQETNGVACRK